MAASGRALWAVVDVAPLMTAPVAIYNIAAAVGAGAGADAFAERLEKPAFQLALPSDGVWWIAGGDLLVMMALCLLFAELLRSGASTAFALTNHALSLLLFVVCLLQFLLLPAFATTTFFLILLMTFLDVLAGVVALIARIRRADGQGYDG